MATIWSCHSQKADVPVPKEEPAQAEFPVKKLSPEELKAGYYTKFVVNALMSTAPKDKAEYYQKALGSGSAKGWLTQNEVRDLEDLDRSTEPEADKLPQPSAATAVPKPADKPADDPGAK